jgi:5-amino-6-(5-phospho-D-ribitylamino)uracil phosphatase
MGFNYKAIFVDLDGTLLNSKKVISQKNLECLNKFVDMGIPVVIATGRTIKSVKKVAQGLKINTPVITLNGSDIRKSIDGYSMMLSYIDNQLKEAVFSMCKDILNGNSNYCIQNILVDTAKGFYCLHPHHLDIEEFSFHYDSDLKELDIDNPPLEAIVSFLFLLTPESNRNAFLEEQSEVLKPYRAKFCTFNGWPWIELGSSTANKGTAMHYVCDYLGIQIKDVIAFGDGENDVEMLAEAGLGVAMSNADIHALQIAKAKALSNDEDGVSVFLEHLKQIGNIQ